VGTINTIAAAGSETSCSTVLVDDMGGGQKRGIWYDAIRPRFAILNPELTYTVDAWQTGVGASDIMAHTVGRYFADPFCALGDEYAAGTMRTVVKYGPIAVAEPENYEARAELMLAAAFSHNGLTFLGKSGPRGGEHGLESQISGHYDTAHGAGLAVVMPAWLQYILDTGTPEQAARVAQFGVDVFGVPPDLADVKATANEGLRRFRFWLRSLGMPLTLKELGVPAADLGHIIQRCMALWNGLVTGWVNLDEKAVTAIFSSVAE